MKGNSVINDEYKTEITKGVFTTCKKRDGCPPWELSAKKIIHDKKKKIINYENAFLKIYDKPVVYFPKFSHPDPTVDRESGFLTPSLKNSRNQKSFLTIPYFLAVLLAALVTEKKHLILESNNRLTSNLITHQLIDASV